MVVKAARQQLSLDCRVSPPALGLPRTLSPSDRSGGMRLPVEEGKERKEVGVSGCAAHQCLLQRRAESYLSKFSLPMSQSPPAGRMIGGKVQLRRSLLCPPRTRPRKDSSHISSRLFVSCSVIASPFFLVNESVEITGS